MLHPLGEDCFYVAVCQGIKNAPAIPAEFYQTHLLQDPELVGEVLKVIKDIAKEGITMIIVTHEMSFASDAANRVIFMAHI